MWTPGHKDGCFFLFFFLHAMILDQIFPEISWDTAEEQLLCEKQD